MSMNGFYDKVKATILKLSSETKNEIGEVTPSYVASGTTNIRLYNKTSQYVRTETGYAKQNQWEAQVPYGSNIVQGDKIQHKGTVYNVVGADDDCSHVFLKLTLEME